MAADDVGVILSAALVGTILLTAVVARWGDRIGRRRLLVAGGLLMTVAVLIPLVPATPLWLAVIGLSGIVSVTANESVGLQTIDQATVPQTVPRAQRTAAYATWSLVAAVAGAAGALAVGPAASLAEAVGISGAQRHIVAFVAFAVCGLLAAALTLALDPRVEAPARPAGVATGLRSRGIVARLAVLFGIDSFASGLAVQSFLAFWFAARFQLPAESIGALFAAGQVLAAASFPISAVLATRYGLIRTMVFTHVPSSGLLIAMALVGDPVLAAACYLGRALLAQMDVPARQSYVASVVPPDERTSAAAITNLAKSGAQAAGPLVAGALLVPSGLGVPLIACGVLKIGYDLALYASFRSRPLPEEPG